MRYRKRLEGLRVCVALVVLAGGLCAAPAQAQNPYVAGPQSRALRWPEPTTANAPAISTGRVISHDSGIAYNFNDRWAAGDMAGVLLEAAASEYPLTIRSVSAYLGCLPNDDYPGASRSVQLKAHIYALSGDSPGALLGSSGITTFDLDDLNCESWVSLNLAPAPVVLTQPQPFLAVIEYISGQEGQTPSLLTDVSTDIPTHACYYRRGGAWSEHYAFWQEGRDIGYGMIRATADVAGGPYGWSTTVSVAQADTFLVSGFPQLNNQGTQPYLRVGYDSTWGIMRPLLRFSLPQPPAPGATVVSARVRLFNDNACSEAVPITLTLYRATAPWTEGSAAWVTQATAYGEAYGTADVLARDPAEPYRLRLLEMDATVLLRDWLSGVRPNDGVMVRGDEETLTSCKGLYARESASATFWPQLVVSWRWPLVTPSPSPSATYTPDPSQWRAVLLPLIRRR